MTQNAKKIAQDRIASLEQQLHLHNEAFEASALSGQKAKRDIEKYFSNCLDALIARRDILIAQVEQRVNDQQRNLQEVNSSVTGCITILKGGLQIYDRNATAAENIWEEVKAIPDIPVVSEIIAVNLPAEFISSIEAHGSVSAFRRCALDGNVTTWAGSNLGFEDGTKTTAQFNAPYGCCYAVDGFLYVCDAGNNALRKISMAGAVQSMQMSSLSHPYGVAMYNKEKTLFITNFNSHTITKITGDHLYERVLAGQTAQAECIDGTGSDARFFNPSGICVDQQTGNIYVSDSSSHTIRKITQQGNVTTIAGSEAGFADGNGKAAKFDNPRGICFDDINQSLLVCDRNNEKLRRVQLNGDVSTLCVASAPSMVALTPKGTILVSSSNDCTLSRVIKGVRGYQMEIIAGSGAKLTANGKPNKCSFNGALGVTVHSNARQCFVSECYGHKIRLVSFVTPLD